MAAVAVGVFAGLGVGERLRRGMALAAGEGVGRTLA
jgi:hypothetical protein